MSGFDYHQEFHLQVMVRNYLDLFKVLKVLIKEIKEHLEKTELLRMRFLHQFRWFHL